MNKKFRALQIILFLSLLTPLTVSGSIITELFDRHWVKKAEFIFFGEVQKIEYKSSQPSQEGDTPIPHTFVTCAILDVYKGTVPPEGTQGRTLTLRFQGGKSEIKPDLYLEIQGIPLFNPGDQGIFFVRMNGESICPLVGFHQGIIRIVNNQVFNGLGQELRIIENLQTAVEESLFDLHPYDILDYEAFEAKLREPNRAIDEILRVNLTDFLRRMKNPSLMGTQPQAIGDPLQKLVPFQLRIPSLSSDNLQLVQQLNLKLKQRRLFTAETLRDVPLRMNTRDLLQKDPLNLSNAELVLLNRRVLEDAYPDLLIRSLEMPIIPQGEPLLASLPYSIGGTELKKSIFNAEGEGGSGGGANQPAPLGSPLSADSLRRQIKDIVDFLHTPEELNALPMVQNLNSAASFSVSPLSIVASPLSVQENIPEPATDHERLERNLLLNNNNDPRVK